MSPYKSCRRWCRSTWSPEYGREELCVDLMKPVESDSLDLDLVDRQREDVNRILDGDGKRGRFRNGL